MTVNLSVENSFTSFGFVSSFYILEQLETGVLKVLLLYNKDHCQIRPCKFHAPLCICNADVQSVHI